jgi:cytidylate kinase
VKPVIAIDGPAGSGKGTIARRLAEYWKFAYLDTGLLYRLVAYSNMESLKEATIATLMKLLAEVPDDVLRSEEVGSKASAIAKLPQVRETMTALQRRFIADPGAKGSVLDGRDIGTVVAPSAECKLFITADVETRAKRRFDILKQNNFQITLAEICKKLKARDKQDRSRKNAPLTFTKDYILIDTTNDTPEESIEKAICASKKLLRQFIS